MPELARHRRGGFAYFTRSLCSIVGIEQTASRAPDTARQPSKTGPSTVSNCEPGLVVDVVAHDDARRIFERAVYHSGTEPPWIDEIPHTCPSDLRSVRR